jgi:hypothetical protein
LIIFPSDYYQLTKNRKINILNESIGKVCLIFVVVDHFNVLIDIILGRVGTLFETEQTLGLLFKEDVKVFFLHLVLEVITVIIGFKGDLVPGRDGQFRFIGIIFFHFFTIAGGIEQLLQH